MSGRSSMDLDSIEVMGDAEDELEADDGISDAPLVRLVNSIIFAAAEDGASDVHFEPQEDALVVRHASTACCSRCSGSRAAWHRR